jgi:hypothetical protein
MKPAVPFAKAADQTALRLLTIELSQVPQPGRLMFCRGRRVLQYGDVSKLADYRYIPPGADILCLSAADYDDVKEWMA